MDSLGGMEGVIYNSLPITTNVDDVLVNFDGNSAVVCLIPSDPEVVYEDPMFVLYPTKQTLMMLETI